MADRSVSLESETNDNQSVVKLKGKNWNQSTKAVIVSLNQTRATDMHFVA